MLQNSINMQKASPRTRRTKSENENPISTDISFMLLLQQWQEANEIRLKGGTKNRYENLIKSHIEPQLGSLKLSEITPSFLNRFLNRKLTNGRLDGKGALSTGYVRSISTIIISALNFAVCEGYIQPFKTKINKPCISKNDLPILSFEKQKSLEKYIKSEISPTSIGILITLYTGLRIGEICALSWDDIDLVNRIIHVRHTVSRVKSTKSNLKTELILDEPKTPSSKRLIPIPSTLFSILLNYREIAISNYVVSSSDNFVSPRTFYSRYRKITERCQLGKFNYHGLRHTFATRCIEAGVDVKSLSEILGHASVSITLNTYVHSSIEMKKSQLEKLTLL